jgi:N-acyl-D-aspartate/D-glutamate deacylase
MSKIRQGVTTVIGGAGESDLTPVERSFAEYLKRGNSVNFGRYCSPPVGRVLAGANRRPTRSELEIITNEVARAMADGALGITFGLRYTPESFLTSADVIFITRAVKAAGGYYNTHMRSESDELIEAIEEVLAINEVVGIATNIGHLKAIGPSNWGKSFRATELIRAARERGLQVTADQYPYEWSGTGLDVITPHWAKEGGRKEFLERWGDRELKDRIATDIDALVRRRGGPGEIVISHFSKEADLEGKTLKEAAELRDLTVAELVMHLYERGGAGCHYHVMSRLDIDHIMTQPWVAVGSDAGVVPLGSGGRSHPRAFGTFPRILDYYVAERSLLTLEDAVRKMTGLPAQITGIRDRGMIREGCWADIVLFDPDGVKDRSTFDDPENYPEGIPWVIVNGVVVLAEGRHTGALPGRPIYGPGYHPD